MDNIVWMEADDDAGSLSLGLRRGPLRRRRTRRPKLRRQRRVLVVLIREMLEFRSMNYSTRRLNFAMDIRVPKEGILMAGAATEWLLVLKRNCLPRHDFNFLHKG